MHPHLKHKFWDSKAREEFMRTEYPSYYQTYRKYGHGVERADMWRIAVLHKYGGVYVDTDIVPVKDITQTPLWGKPLVFGSWEDMTGSFIIAQTPGNPLLLGILEYMVRAFKNPLYKFLPRNVRISLTTGSDAIKRNVPRTKAYYIPRQEFMPCSVCEENTPVCEVNEGRYFLHLDGKTWNGGTERLLNRLYCFAKTYTVHILLAVITLLLVLMKLRK